MINTRKNVCEENVYKYIFSPYLTVADLRHYYASLMLSLGIPDKYAMTRMGHATPNMLRNVYQHLRDEKDREATAAINSHFDTMQRNMQLNNSDTNQNGAEKDNIV